MPRLDPEAITPPHVNRNAAETERVVGGRVLLAVGAFVLLLGVAFFLKYAFDNGWIGPSGRVAIGLLAGAGLLFASERLRWMAQRVFAEGLTALGAGVLYLSLWAAGNGFHILPVTVSFIGMAAVTAMLILLASRRDSEMTATWGLLGGFLSPYLAATQDPAWLNLYIYLAILNAALLFVPRKQQWKFIAPVAFVFTQIDLFLGAYARDLQNATAPSLTLLIAAATIYLGLFMYRPVTKALKHDSYDISDYVVTILSALAYYAMLHAELYTHSRLVLTASVIVLAAAYLTLAYIETRTRPLYAAIALALITGGVAITFNGDVITALWSIEGALLAWVGFRLNVPVVRVFALIAFVCAGLHLAINFPDGGAPFANERFVTLMICGAALGTARLAARQPRLGQDAEGMLLLLAELAAHGTIVSAISTELWTWSGHNELAITLFLLVYGAALLVTGFVRNTLSMRLEALALLAIAVLKAFVTDMSALDPAIRIVSFLALGAVLLAISYWYLRVRNATARGEQ